MSLAQSASRIFVDASETHALLSNLFGSLCRSDQDEWLRKVGLQRTTNIDGSPLAPDAGGPGSPTFSADGKPTRGFSALHQLISVTPKKAGEYKPKFDVATARVRQALVLAGEDHTPEDETAMPRLFDITVEGARGKKGAMRGWFDDIAAASAGPAKADADAEGDAAAEPHAEVIDVAAARKEYCEQEHFGQPWPEKKFDAAVSKFPMVAKRGGKLSFDEFVAIFSHFESS